MSEQQFLRPSLLAKALLAYSIHEHQLGHVRTIELLLGSNELVLQDDGRGMGLERSDYVENLLGTLVGGRGEVQLHGIGLSLVAASAPTLKVEACRGGAWLAQSFSRGVPLSAPSRISDCAHRGTRITVSSLPAMSAAELADVEAQVKLWLAANPGLRISVHASSARVPPSNGA